MKPIEIFAACVGLVATGATGMYIISSSYVPQSVFDQRFSDQNRRIEGLEKQITKLVIDAGLLDELEKKVDELCFAPKEKDASISSLVQRGQSAINEISKDSYFVVSEKGANARKDIEEVLREVSELHAEIIRERNYCNG